MELEDTRIEVPAYLAKLDERGGIVEERIVGDELRSPSVQMRVTPLGEVEVLSTHDQVLGGPSGQSYLGCRFPAEAAYAPVITEHAERIGRLLADEGVLGRFAVDFVTVRRGEEWEAYAIEINLRKGGTTHPFLTLQFLTDGRYDPATAAFVTPAGETRHLVATDHLQDPSLRGLQVEDLFDLIVRCGLHFDQARQTGIVFHMIGGLTALGRVGMTAISRHPCRDGGPVLGGRGGADRGGAGGHAASPALPLTDPSRREGVGVDERLDDRLAPGPPRAGGAPRRAAAPALPHPAVVGAVHRRVVVCRVPVSSAAHGRLLSPLAPASAGYLPPSSVEGGSVGAARCGWSVPAVTERRPGAALAAWIEASSGRCRMPTDGSSSPLPTDAASPGARSSSTRRTSRTRSTSWPRAGWRCVARRPPGTR